MAKTKAVAKHKTIIPREIRQLFGPPPLLGAGKSRPLRKDVCRIRSISAATRCPRVDDRA